MADMEKRLESIYKQAARDIGRKLKDFERRHKVKDKQMREDLAAGKITPAQYKNWLAGQVFIGKQWKDKQESIANTLLHANQIANDIIEGEKRAVFGKAAMHQSYDLERNLNIETSFSVYDSATVTRLIREQPELLPRRVVNGKKDKAWNRTKIATAVTQGIIQGESIPEIARRIAEKTSSQDMGAMVRYARTAMTGAQNAGRIAVMERAKDMGIDVQKKWLATLDMKTRDSHAMLDGQVRDVNKPFDSELGKIMYPGDPNAAPADVYNCRCTLVYVYPEYTPNGVGKRRDNTNSEEIEDMTYQEWLEMKKTGTKPVPKPAPQPVKQPEPEPEPEMTRIEKMEKMISEHQGDWTLDELQEIGKEFAAEVEEREKSKTDEKSEAVRILKDQLSKLIKLRDETAAKRQDLHDRYMKLYLKRDKTDAERREMAQIYNELMEAMDKYRDLLIQINGKDKQIYDLTNNFGSTVRSVLNELRTCGGIDANNVDNYADFKRYRTKVNDTKAAAISAFNHYPKSWLDASASYGITLKPHWTTGRAYYSPLGEIRFDGDIGTCVHELGHRFEQVVPGIRKSEQDFYTKRTAGQPLEWLGPGYSRDEKTRKDQFLHPYMGKWYGGQAFELVSMGFEYAFTNYGMLSKDPDMQTWILGILASIP